MGTMSRMRNSVPWRMPQAIDPNSHSPRNRNVPMAMSSRASTTRLMAADAHRPMMPSSRPVSGELRLEQVDVGHDEAQDPEPDPPDRLGNTGSVAWGVVGAGGSRTVRSRVVRRRALRSRA